MCFMVTLMLFEWLFSNVYCTLQLDFFDQCARTVRYTFTHLCIARIYTYSQHYDEHKKKIRTTKKCFSTKWPSPNLCSKLNVVYDSS